MEGGDEDEEEEEEKDEVETADDVAAGKNCDSGFGGPARD